MKIMDTKQVAEYLHIHPGTLHRWRSEGRGPVYIKGDGTTTPVQYLQEDVDLWLISRRVEPGEKVENEPNRAR